MLKGRAQSNDSGKDFATEYLQHSAMLANRDARYPEQIFKCIIHAWEKFELSGGVRAIEELKRSFIIVQRSRALLKITEGKDE